MRRFGNWIKSTGSFLWDLVRITGALLVVAICMFVVGVLAHVAWDLFLFGFNLW